MNESLPIACDLTAIPASIREVHVASIPQVFRSAQEIRELPNGYAFRFSNEPGAFMRLAQFVDNERLCCPFYGFTLEIEAGGAPLWLRLTGTEGVKDFLESAFGELYEALATQANTDRDESLARARSALAKILGKAPAPPTSGK